MAFASFKAATNWILRYSLQSLIPTLTYVVYYSTAVVLQARSVAHKAEAGHLADDLDVAGLGVVLQSPRGPVQQPLRPLQRHVSEDWRRQTKAFQPGYWGQHKQLCFEDL